MEMMYSLISKALNEQGLLGQQHPRDYLTFFCLGNRCVNFVRFLLVNLLECVCRLTADDYAP